MNLQLVCTCGVWKIFDGLSRKDTDYLFKDLFHAVGVFVQYHENSIEWKYHTCPIRWIRTTGRIKINTTEDVILVDELLQPRSHVIVLRMNRCVMYVFTDFISIFSLVSLEMTDFIHDIRPTCKRQRNISILLVVYSLKAFRMTQSSSQELNCNSSHVIMSSLLFHYCISLNKGWNGKVRDRLGGVRFPDRLLVSTSSSTFKSSTIPSRFPFQ